MTDKPNDWYICQQCDHDFPLEDARVECVFAATQEEPAEYLAHCPQCGATHLNEEQRCWCEGCDKERVKDFGDYCTECRECYLEDKADAKREDEFMSFAEGGIKSVEFEGKTYK